MAGRSWLHLEGGFHGRSSLAVQATGNAELSTSLNADTDVLFLEFDRFEELEKIDHSVAAVIIEGIRSIGGVHYPNAEFLNLLYQRCKDTGAILISDEVQSGLVVQVNSLPVNGVGLNQIYSLALKEWVTGSRWAPPLSKNV